MSDTDLRNSSAAHRYSGGILCARQCSADGSSTLTTWTILPRFQSKGSTPTYDESDLPDATGATIASENVLKSFEMDVDFLQFDKATLDFIDGAHGNTYNVYEYAGIINGKYVELYYPICNINGSGEDRSDWNKASVKIKSLSNTAAVALTTSLPSVAKASALTTVAIAKQRSITETTVT